MCTNTELILSADRDKERAHEHGAKSGRTNLNLEWPVKALRDRAQRITSHLVTAAKLLEGIKCYRQ